MARDGEQQEPDLDENVFGEEAEADDPFWRVVDELTNSQPAEKASGGDGA